MNGVVGIAPITNFETKKKRIFSKKNWKTKKSDYLCVGDEFFFSCGFNWLVSCLGTPVVKRECFSF